MRILTALSLTLVMTACGESAPTETVESLVANPERLKELREQCRADRAKLGDELCNAVAEATRQRFMGIAQEYGGNAILLAVCQASFGKIQCAFTHPNQRIHTRKLPITNGKILVSAVCTLHPMIQGCMRQVDHLIVFCG